MIHALIDANNFAEAYIQGVIKGIFMLLFFLALSAIIKLVKKKDKVKQSDLISENTLIVDKEENKMMTQLPNQKVVAKNQMQSIFKKWYNYFFVNNLNKGYKRLLIMGSFILPLGLAFLLYYGSAVEGINSYDEVYIYYDDSTLLIGFILGYILYWTIYCVIVWIIKGFQDEKKIN